MLLLCLARKNSQNLQQQIHGMYNGAATKGIHKLQWANTNNNDIV